MDRGKVEDWFQVVGILAIVGSLIFVGLQIRQATETRDFEGALEAQESSVEWFALLAEHGDIWLRGCAGDPLTDEERFVFRKLSVAWLHREAWIWLRGDSIGSALTKNDAVYSVALNLHSFEGLRRELDASEAFNQLGFGGSKLPQFSEEIAVRMTQLAKENPKPNFDPRFCGE